jgi:glucosamine--fructose-6-phosphate aminotransferase (isomerizing)
VLSEAEELTLVGALVDLPRQISRAVRDQGQYEALGLWLSKARNVFYLGRGFGYPLALEGALKLKEISYIHAEGYAAGELKHGPIALIDEHMPVIVVVPKDGLFDKTVSNMQEVAARGGRILAITDATPEELGCKTEGIIRMPTVPQFVSPLLYSLPLQLLAYHTAVIMGRDVDQPRNLAKSVTVE